MAISYCLLHIDRERRRCKAALKYLDAACRYLHWESKRETGMKKIILVGAFALLAACGSSAKESLPAAGADNTSASAATSGGGASTETSLGGTDDTITVTELSDMPPKCVELLGKFLKQIEPTVSKIDWDKATLADFEAFGTQFQAESDSFDKDTTAAGCDKYNLEGSDEKQFQQMEALAQSEAPGTVGFIKFLNSLSASASGSGGAVPSDCDGTIAEIDPFVKRGGTMQDLTMAEVTRLGQLITAVQTNCTGDEATAFFARADVKAFMGG
jgi:hypothetical protein